VEGLGEEEDGWEAEDGNGEISVGVGGNGRKGRGRKSRGRKSLKAEKVAEGEGLAVTTGPLEGLHVNP
jgi:hypothetical protein